jgi:hypothetical protein
VAWLYMHHTYLIRSFTYHLRTNHSILLARATLYGSNFTVLWKRIFSIYHNLDWFLS